MFAMFIDTGDHSSIQMGGYDLKKYAKPGAELKWYELTSDFFWEFKFNNVQLGDLDFYPSVEYMMADTGTSLNMIPNEDFDKIYNHFFKDKLECRKLANTLTSCQCTKE